MTAKTDWWGDTLKRYRRRVSMYLSRPKISFGVSLSLRSTAFDFGVVTPLASVEFELCWWAPWDRTQAYCGPWLGLYLLGLNLDLDGQVVDVRRW